MRERLGISVCLIVKNEEVLLPAALASVTNFAGEVLVGDTGSTDATVRIAEAAGARVIQVPWTGDFAGARNAVLDQARHPWILYFDADHRASDKVGPWLARHLPTLADGAYNGVFLDPGAQRGHQRTVLFRHGVGIRWERALHERPVWPDGAAVQATLVPDLLFWTVDGQRDEAVEVRKHERYIAQLQAELAASPDSQIAQHYLVYSLHYLKRYDEACAVLQAAWDDPGLRAAWDPGVLACRLAVMYRAQGDWVQAGAWATEALAHDGDSLFAREIITVARYRQDGAAAALQAAEEWWRACRGASVRVRQDLLLNAGMLQDACRYVVWGLAAAERWSEAKAVASQPGAPPDCLLHVHLAAGELDQALRLYCRGQADPAGAHRRWADLRAACVELPGMVEALLWGSLADPAYAAMAHERLTDLIARYPEATAPYRRRAELAIKRGGDLAMAKADLGASLTRQDRDPEGWLMLGDLARHFGQPEEARRAYTTVVALRPDWTRARAQLADLDKQPADGS